MPRQTVHYYSEKAAEFAKKYESIRFDDIHQDWIDLLPQSGTILDIGAGTGRDAAYLAQKGYSVTALEPAEGMRQQGMQLHAEDNIHWIEDSLPELTNVIALEQKYDLILICAVWMHLPPHTRSTAFERLVSLLKPSGALIITLRQGAFEDQRSNYAVSITELANCANQHNLIMRSFSGDNRDPHGRENINWQTVCCKLPG